MSSFGSGLTDQRQQSVTGQVACWLGLEEMIRRIIRDPGLNIIQHHRNRGGSHIGGCQLASLGPWAVSQEGLTD